MDKTIFWNYSETTWNKHYKAIKEFKEQGKKMPQGSHSIWLSKSIYVTILYLTIYLLYVIII